MTQIIFLCYHDYLTVLLKQLITSVSVASGGYSPRCITARSLNIKHQPPQPRRKVVKQLCELFSISRSYYFCQLVPFLVFISNIDVRETARQANFCSCHQCITVQLQRGLIQVICSFQLRTSSRFNSMEAKSYQPRAIRL